MINAKWLFFDIGSTLADESLCYQKRYDEIAALGNISRSEFENKVIEFAACKASACHAAAGFYNLPIPPWHKELERLYPDAHRVLRELGSKYHMGIIANQSTGSKERLQSWGIDQYFDVVIASAEEGISKPDLGIFKLALERADCNPEDAVMIGDRLDNDIVPAKKIGMQTIWIRQGFAAYHQPPCEGEIPDAEVESLTDLIPLLLP